MRTMTAITAQHDYYVITKWALNRTQNGINIPPAKTKYSLTTTITVTAMITIRNSITYRVESLAYIV